MSLFVVSKTLSGKEKVEVDVKELRLRLQSLTSECNIEIIQLAISSILDEIEDAIGIFEK